MLKVGSRLSCFKLLSHATSHVSPQVLGVCHCILLFSLLLTVQSAPKNSLKKRLAEYEAAKSDPINDASATASSSSAALGRGSRQRLEQYESESITEPTTARPLTDSLKRDWAAGHLTAKKVVCIECIEARRPLIGRHCSNGRSW